MTGSDLSKSIGFHLLGPLEIRVNGRVVPVGGPRAQALLAALLLDAGQTVSVPRLVEAVWEENAPKTARMQVRNRASNLRRLLLAFGAPTGVVSRVGSGYVIDAAAGQRDIDAFERLVGEADRLQDGGAHGAAADRLSAALALWRGPALDGLHSGVLMAAARRLNERRLTAFEQHIDLRLALGEHQGVVADLVEPVAEYPWRERLVGQLMLALYRDGRQRDALRQFDQARGRLADELGVDPSPDLVQLRDLILRNDVALRGERPAVARPTKAARVARPPGPGRPPQVLPPAVATRPVPRELPANVHGFTGHGAALTSLDDLLSGACDDHLVLALITGPAGVGKTAVAVRWAHRVADAFPDGQLFVDLNGYGSRRATRPVEALAQLLGSLGVPPGRVPHSEREAAALYRSSLAGRRILVVLDNAYSAEQVRPLLPGDAGCLVLVTSREYLAGLVARNGARQIEVGVLDRDEAVDLLDRLVGRARTRAEPDATAELASLCGYLPLALRTAASELVGDPCRGIAAYVASTRE